MPHRNWMRNMRRPRGQPCKQDLSPRFVDRADTVTLVRVGQDFTLCLVKTTSKRGRMTEAELRIASESIDVDVLIKFSSVTKGIN